MGVFKLTCTETPCTFENWMPKRRYILCTMATCVQVVTQCVRTTSRSISNVSQHHQLGRKKEVSGKEKFYFQFPRPRLASIFFSNVHAKLHSAVSPVLTLH